MLVKVGEITGVMNHAKGYMPVNRGSQKLVKQYTTCQMYFRESKELVIFFLRYIVLSLASAG